MAPTPKYSQPVNVTVLAGYHTSLFEPEPFNPKNSLEEIFLSEDHLYSDYDAFGDLIGDSPNAVSPWHQHYCNSAKDGTMLEVDDPVFKELWNKYPCVDDCCGECPGCCAFEYESNIESSQDISSGSFGWFTSTIFSIVLDYVAMSLGQW
jgi:hypothetical protein